jgi:predicted nucleic acid-binding Zn ribbon protein
MGRYSAKKIDGIIGSLIGRKKWRRGISDAEIALRWSEMVGPKIAEHTEPVLLSRNRLEVRCDHDVWRTELQFLKPELLKKIAEELGEGVVREIYLK